MVEVSFNELLKIFPRFFAGLSVSMRTVVLDIKNQKLSTIFLFLIKNDLDLACMKLILTQAISFSSLHRIHLTPHDQWCCNGHVIHIRSDHWLIHSCLHHTSSKIDHHIYGKGKEGSWNHTGYNDTPLKSMPVGNYKLGRDSHLTVVVIVKVKWLFLPGTWYLVRASPTNLYEMDPYALVRSNHNATMTPLLSLAALNNCNDYSSMFETSRKTRNSPLLHWSVDVIIHQKKSYQLPW